MRVARNYSRETRETCYRRVTGSTLLTGEIVPTIVSQPQVVITGSHVPTMIGLVADDFTGAADSAGVFTRHGWAVRLLVDDADDTDTDTHTDTGADAPAEPNTVLAIATGSRSLSEADAADVTARAVRRLAAAGAQRLFVKVDSTMRGPVPGQVNGAMDGWGATHPTTRAVVAPAFPAQGRTVVGGVVLVDGTPVDETASGRDPFAPVASSRLADLLPGFHRLPSPHALPSTDALSSFPARTYADARTDRDLDELTHLIEQDPAVVAVGSAGLASALARRWRHAARPAVPHAVVGGIVVAVTSLHPVSARQVSELTASTRPGVNIVTTPAAADRSPERVADGLARRVSALVQAQDVGALVVVGGDGVASVLRDLRATAVSIDDVLEAGCPTGTIVGGVAHGVRIVSKSGGFGSPSALVDLVSLLQSTPGCSEPPVRSTH
jgi:uncharacterized protein YgbK (DUF1537 family)